MNNVLVMIYEDYEVRQLPEPLQEQIYSGFFQFPKEIIAKAPIRTWRDFLMYSTIEQENEDSWWDVFEEAKVKEYVKDNLYIVEIDILDNEKETYYEFHSEFENCAIVNLNKPVLVCDADAEYFGYGYIILNVFPETKEAWLFCDLLSYDDCINWLKDLVIKI